MTQIRLQPVVVQNVTTYGTVITVPNRELKLKPGMTANVKIEIAKRTNALRIPNAALRFRPTAEVFAALNRRRRRNDGGSGGGRGGRGGGGWAERQRVGASADRRRRQHHAMPTRRQTVATGDAAAAAQSAAARPRSAGGGGGRGGGGGAAAADGRSRIPGAHARALQDDVARGAAAVHRAHEGTRRRHERVRKSGSPAKRSEVSGGRASAQTIDALFAPLPVVETRGRAWLFIDNQLKPVALRLGISDGTYTELISDGAAGDMEVVTGVTGLASTRGTPTQGGSGNPLMPWPRRAWRRADVAARG